MKYTKFTSFFLPSPRTKTTLYSGWRTTTLIRAPQACNTSCNSCHLCKFCLPEKF